MLIWLSIRTACNYFVDHESLFRHGNITQRMTRHSRGWKQQNSKLLPCVYLLDSSEEKINTRILKKNHEGVCSYTTSSLWCGVRSVMLSWQKSASHLNSSNSSNTFEHSNKTVKQSTFMCLRSRHWRLSFSKVITGSKPKTFHIGHCHVQD